MSSKVLIVEDSSTTRAMIISIIEVIEGIQIFESKNGFEALKLLPHHAFSLIITDVNMPNINGLELVGFVKQNPNYKHIPLIIVTTEGSEKDKEKGFALGANEYVIKPFNAETLQNLVRKYIK